MDPQVFLARDWLSDKIFRTKRQNLIFFEFTSINIFPEGGEASKGRKFNYLQNEVLSRQYFIFCKTTTFVSTAFMILYKILQYIYNLYVKNYIFTPGSLVVGVGGGRTQHFELFSAGKGRFKVLKKKEMRKRKHICFDGSLDKHVQSPGSTEILKKN